MSESSGRWNRRLASKYGKVVSLRNCGNCVGGNADSSFAGFTELSILKGLSPPVDRQADRLRKKECGTS